VSPLEIAEKDDCAPAANPIVAAGIFLNRNLRRFMISPLRIPQPKVCAYDDVLKDACQAFGGLFLRSPCGGKVIKSVDIN
jgi:hypothetical protein